MSTIYCLCPQTYWQSFEGRDQYLPRDYEQEGFIHATKGDELLCRVANRVYTDFSGDLLVLVIAEAKVLSPIKYEMAKDGLLYPHIYGPLNTDAIVDIRRMEKRDGHWALGPSIRPKKA
jgi:uncharacterized protein (DUF952 family)